MELILIILVLVFLFGAWPRWSYSRDWGYGPTGIIGFILLVLLLLWLTGNLHVPGRLR